MDPLELTLMEAAAALRTRQLGHLEYIQALLAQTDRLSPRMPGSSVILND